MLSAAPAPGSRRSPASPARHAAPAAPAPRSHRRRAPRALAATATLLVLLAGCSSGSGTSGANGTAPAGSAPAGTAAATAEGDASRLVVGEPVAAGTESAAPSGSWAGPVPGSEAFAAIVSDGRQLMAYVCDGNQIGRWFRTDLRDPDPVVVDGDGWLLAVHLDAGAVTGSIETPEGESVALDLPAAPDGSSPLYRAREVVDEGTLLAGWVVLPDGRQRGTFSFTPSTALDGAKVTSSTLQPAPTLSLASGTVVEPVQITTVPNLALINALPNPVTSAGLGQPVTNKPFEWVMVTLGDSYAAGEGAPDVNGQFDDGGQLPSGKAKEQWSDQPPNHPDVEACHRSDRAAGPQVASDLAAEFPAVKVIHQSFACSGAKIENLRNTTYPGADSHVNDVTVSPQLTQVKNWFNKTGPVAFPGTVDKIDLLYLNVGGNNAGFGDVIGACIGPFSNCSTDATMHAAVAANFAGLRDRYNALGTDLATLTYQKPSGQNVPIAPAKVVIQTIPNPLHDETGALCNGPDEDRMKNEQLRELTTVEANWAEVNVLVPLNEAITTAANDNHWTPVTGITEASATHGICSTSPWINNVRDALHHQGEDVRLDGVAGFVNSTPLVNLSSGMVHPNAAGFRAIADKAALKVRPAFVTRFTPSTPGRLRVGSAAVRGDIVLRWDDVSNNEQRFELEESFLQADGTFVGPFTDDLPADTQSATLAISGAQTARYRIRACGPAAGEKLCSPWSEPIVASNLPPKEPANVAATPQWTGLGANYRVRITFTDQAGPTKVGGPATIVAALTKGSDVRQYIVRSATSTATTVLAGPSSSDVIAAGTYSLKLRSCNLAGCSEPLTPIDVTVPATPPPTTTTTSAPPPKFTTTTTRPQQ